MFMRELTIVGRNSWNSSVIPCYWAPTCSSIRKSVSAFIQIRCTSNASLDLQHPRTPHRAKSRLLKAVEPIYIPRSINPSEHCAKRLGFVTTLDLPEHPLEILLARKAYEVLATSKLIILCHRNSMTQETLKAYRNSVWKLDVRLWQEFNNRVLRIAIRNTKYATLNDFLFDTNMIITSKEADFAKMSRALKRIPSLTAMVAIVDHSRFISPSQLDALAKKYKDGVLSAHSELSTTLANVSGSLLQSLQHHGSTLTSNLSYRAKDITSNSPINADAVSSNS